MITVMKQEQLIQSLGTLFCKSLKITGPVSQLFLIREKIAARGYREFDKKDIMDELGRLQHMAAELHKDMICIYDQLSSETRVIKS